MGFEITTERSIPMSRIVVGSTVAFLASAVAYKLGLGPGSIGLGIGLGIGLDYVMTRALRSG